MRIKICLPLITFIASLSGVCAAAETPKEVVQTFYEALMHPEPGDYGQPHYLSVEGSLSPVLSRALRAQDEYESACIAITPPDMKPHILDQSPFFRAPEGAKTLSKLTQVLSGHTAKVSADLGYEDFEWQDTVTLVFHEGRWVIVNVSWGDGGSLIDRLKGFAASRCTPS